MPATGHLVRGGTAGPGEYNTDYFYIFDCEVDLLVAVRRHLVEYFVPLPFSLGMESASYVLNL